MHEVAVLGGGPAGCAAAITLARRGRSVVLLERNHGARQGFCGEFLSPDGVGSLEALGVLDGVLSAGPAVVSDWDLCGTSTALRGRLPAPALGISRRILDPLLRRTAAARGAEVHEAAQVQRVDSETDRFEITLLDGRVFSAAHVVRATGRSARIAGLDTDGPVGAREFVAFKAHFRGVVPRDRIRLFPLGGAYVGVGPIEDDLVNVCFLARREAYDAAGATPEAILDSAAGTQPAWNGCWSGLRLASDRWLSTGGLFFRARRTRPRPRVTSCGDAAGLISPFLGEGMSMALEAGTLVGSLVDTHFEAPDRLLDEYTDLWSRRFGSRMRWGERLQRLLLSNRADPALRWLGLVPALPKAIVRRTRSTALANQGARALRERALTTV